MGGVDDFALAGAVLVLHEHLDCLLVLGVECHLVGGQFVGVNQVDIDSPRFEKLLEAVI